MEDKLDFSLPEKKQKNSLAPKIIIILLLVLIGLAAANFLTKSPNKILPVENVSSSFSAEQVKELAAKLAGRNLYTRAAKAWQDYLLLAELPDTEKAKTLFRIGTLLKKAGKYEEAIEYYYRSETAAKLSELEPQINAHIKDCFEKLGMFSALRYELMDRTSYGKKSEAGGKIVAEIGAEKFTEADLNAYIERAIDNQLAPIAAFMTTEQLNEQKKRVLEQYKNPSAKQQLLETWIAQEVLYREALEEKLSEEPEVKTMIEDLVRGTLSQQLMNKELANKINITETDLQTYYKANQDKFIEPADEEDPNSAERQKSFDEVRQQIAQQLLSEKRQDVYQDYIKEMMDKYNVIIHSLEPAEIKEDK
jgi:hypothetical protein